MRTRKTTIKWFVDFDKEEKYLNDMAVAGSFNVVSRYTVLGEGKQAHDCIGCGQCETVCPQKIRVPEELRKLAALMEKQKTWEEVCAERAAIAEAAKQGK